MQQFIDFAANNLLLFGMLIIILALLVRSYLSPGGMKGVSPLEAIRLSNNQSAAILDVRTQAEFEDGHILNAINIPLGNLDTRINDIKDLKESPLIIVCQSGNRSGKAGSILSKQGFISMYNLTGGMHAWKSANLPVSKKARSKALAQTNTSESSSAQAKDLDEADANSQFNVDVYTARHCSHCAKVLRLFKKKGIKFREISVDETPQNREEMIERAKKDTVPQVFIGRQHVGGCDEVFKLDREGELDSMLGLAHA